MDKTLFEKYYQRELQGKDLFDFEEKLRLDESFVKSYKAYIKSKNNATRLSLEEEKKLKTRSIIRNTAITAAVILFVCFSYFINKQTSKDHVTLAQNFYEEPASLQLASTNNKDNIFQTAFTLFKEKKYTKAKEAYRNILHRDPKNMDALEGLAHSQYQLKEWTEAKRHFTNLYEHHTDQSSIENNEWMLVLIELQNKADKSSLVEWLNPMLKNENHAYHFKAKKMMESL